MGKTFYYKTILILAVIAVALYMFYKKQKESMLYYDIMYIKRVQELIIDQNINNITNQSITNAMRAKPLFFSEKDIQLLESSWEIVEQDNNSYIKMKILLGSACNIDKELDDNSMQTGFGFTKEKMICDTFNKPVTYYYKIN